MEVKIEIIAPETLSEILDEEISKTECSSTESNEVFRTSVSTDHEISPLEYSKPTGPFDPGQSAIKTEMVKEESSPSPIDNAENLQKFKMIECPMCYEQFISLDLVNEHFLARHSRPSLDNNYKKFNEGIQPVPKPKRVKYSCCDCEFIGKDKNDINKHRLNVHLTEKRFKCNQCDYKTNRSGALKIHMLRVHHHKR